MAIDRNYYRVYLKTSWDGNPATWVLHPELWPLAAQRNAAPGIGTATLKRVYGRGWYEDLTALVNGTALASLAGAFVKITRCDNTGGDNEELLFVGTFPAEGHDLKGQSADGYRSDDHILTAVELDWMLGDRIETATVVDTQATKIIQWVPPFNQRTPTGGVRGNKSGIQYEKDGVTSYVFEQADYLEGTPWGVWSAYDVLVYLQRFFPASMDITLSMSAGLQAALQSLQGVWNFDGRTCREAICELIRPEMGFSWCLVVGTDDAITLKVYSLLDSDLTVGSITLPVHDPADDTELSLWTDQEKTQVQIAADGSAMADTITVKGGLIKVAGTFSFADDTLECDWRADDQDLYIAGVSESLDGYDGLDDDMKAFHNDRFRDSDRMGKVFTAYRVPKDWDWTVSNIEESDTQPMNPLWDAETGTIDMTEPGVFWNGGKRFLPFLPFQEGYSYDEGDPVNHNRTVTEPQWRRAFALVQRNGRWEYCDKMRPRYATVQPMTDQPGMTVRFVPAHVLGLNWFDPDADPPSQLSTEDFDAAAADFTQLAVTAMIETDQVFCRTLNLGTTTGRQRTIEVPQAELWLAVEGTVYDIGPDGELKRFCCTNPALRDDTAVLESILAAAAAWYGRTRYKATIRHEKVSPILEIGTMIYGLDVDGAGTRGGCVSSIQYDFERSVTTVQTDFAELDILAVYGGGGGKSGKSRLGADRSAYVRVERRLDVVEKELATPRRVGGLFAASGGGGSTSFIEAVVVQGVQYADPAGEPPEGYATYRVRLKSDGTADWDYQQEYQIGDAVIASDGRKYTALTVNTGNDPINSPSHWEVEAEIEPKILNWETATDQRHFMPHYKKDQTVWLISKSGVYYFAQQMLRAAGGGSDGSLRWDAADNRVKAVFG
jgi:hypothetical protein